MYPESLGATVIGLVALSVVRRFEGKDDGSVRRRIAVTTVGGADAVPGLSPPSAPPDARHRTRSTRASARKGA